MSEKDILYSLLGREIDNLMSINPTTAFMSGVVKRWLFQYIDPYVSLFMDGEEIQTDTATAFLEDEISQKIEKFKKKFEEEARIGKQEQ